MLAAAAAGLIIAAIAPATAVATPVASDPCARQTQCFEFGRADVTGDGAVDRIGYRVIGFDPDKPFGKVTLRVIVATLDGQRFTYDSTHRLAIEGAYGAAPIDGVPGAEIALSWLRGAHTSVVEVVTFRDGRLVAEKSWLRDGSSTYGVGVEWIPGLTPQAPIMRRCAYTDPGTSPRPRLRTTTIDFTWQQGAWVAGQPTFTDYRLVERVPWQCSRFRVPGMSRTPMNVFT
jgi:hypothetical protein